MRGVRPFLFVVLAACGGAARTTPRPPPPPATSSTTPAAPIRANYKCPPPRPSPFTVISEDAPVTPAAPQVVVETAPKKRGRKTAPPPPQPPPQPEQTTVQHRDAAWGPDDATLLVVYERGDSKGVKPIANILDLKTGAVRTSMSALSGARMQLSARFHSAEWSADGSLVGLMRSDGIALWDGRASAPSRVVDSDVALESDDRQFAFAPTGRTFATWYPAEKQLRLYDGKENSKPFRTIAPSAEGNVELHAFALSSDSSKLAVAVVVNTSSERLAEIRIYETATGAISRTLHSGTRHGSGTVTAIFWTPKGRALLTLESTGVIDLWNAATDDPPTSLLDSVATGPAALVDGGNLLLIGGLSLDTWDLRSRSKTREIAGDASTIEHVRVNRAGDVVALARGDHTDLIRLSDNTHLTIRATGSANGMLIHADNGLYTGAREAFTQMRAKLERGATIPRPIRPDETNELYRPTLVLDFLAGCPLGAKL